MDRWIDWVHLDDVHSSWGYWNMHEISRERGVGGGIVCTIRLSSVSVTAMTSIVFSCFFFLTLKCILWSSGTEVSSTHRKLTVCKLYITCFRRIINIIYSREQLAPAVGLPWLPPPLSLCLLLSLSVTCSDLSTESETVNFASGRGKRLFGYQIKHQVSASSVQREEN